MNELEERIRHELHRAAESATPPRDLAARVVTSTVQAPPSTVVPIWRNPRWMAPSLAAAIVLATAIGLAVAAPGHHRSKVAAPVTSAEPTAPDPTPTASPSTSVHSSAARSTTPSQQPSNAKQWYHGQPLAAEVQLPCQDTAVVDRQLVLTGSPSAATIVAVQGRCGTGPSSFIVFVTAIAGQTKALTPWVFIPALPSDVQVAGNAVRYQYHALSARGVAVGGLATYSGSASVSGQSVTMTTPVDVTPRCSAAALGTGRLTYQQGVVNGVWFTAPTSPCWVPMYGFSLTARDSANHVVFGPYQGVTSDISPRYYVTDPAHGNLFHVSLNIGLTTYDAHMCLAGETSPITQLDVTYSWGTTQHLTIAPTWACQTAAGEMGLGKQ